MNRDKATQRAAMPKGTSVVLDSRTLQNSYATLIPLLKEGMHVLDLGCGTGAISAGIAAAVGLSGTVTGIDNSGHLIDKGQLDYQGVSNLTLLTADIFTWQPIRKFDLVVSARVFQWLSNPADALKKCAAMLVPGGKLSVLDYNHAGLEWVPAPPPAMQRFYSAFLDWRADAGMDNQMADHLPLLFQQAGFSQIQVQEANESCGRGEAGFADKAAIWSAVARLRGPQMVQSGFITETERLQAIDDYDAWLKEGALSMTMKLKDIQAVLSS